MVTLDTAQIKRIIEGCLLSAGEAISCKQLLNIIGEESLTINELKDILNLLSEEYADRGIELRELAGGWRFQVRSDLSYWVSKLWAEKPPRYSRPLLETLALIAYRQPISRGEIENVRGVAVSSDIIRRLTERGWVKVVGRKDVPGRPELFGTTAAFLDYFNLKSLSELPELADVRDLDQLAEQLEIGVVTNEENEENEKNEENFEEGVAEETELVAEDATEVAEAEVIAGEAV